MSFLVADSIQDCQNELNVIDQRLTQDDWLLFHNRTNKYFMTSYKMPTTQRVQDYLIFNSVREYQLPTGFVGMMNLERPYELDQQNFYHGTQANFIRWTQENWSAIKFDKETEILMLNYLQGDKMVVQPLSDLTSNGTFVVAGDGSALAIDKQYYTAGEGSMRMTVTGSTGQLTLTGTGITAFDLTDYITNGYTFLDVFNSSTTVPLTSIQIRIGSDASNYYQTAAVTTRYNGQTLQGSFGQVGFDFTQKTTTGSPTLTALTYIQIIINFPTTFNGTLRVDNLFVANPIYFTLPYYSLYNVKTSANAYQEKVTATSDTLMCPVEFNEAFTYKICAMGALLKLSDATMANYFENKASEKEADLRAKYPNQEKRTQTTYYKNWNKF